MSEAVTPGAEESKTPVTPATPANATPGSETVTISKEVHDQLQRDAARAAAAQSKLDSLRGASKRNGGNFNATKKAAPATPPEDESDDNGIEEDVKAERGLLQIAVDPRYREVLDADPTLRELFIRNPLGVLPIMAKDAFDAEDALSLVKDELEKRLANLKKPTSPQPKEEPKAPDSPAAGAINPSDVEINAEYEAAKKISGTEQAIAGMIKANLKKFGRK